MAMKKLKVPSLQHLARNWRESPALIQRTLVDMAHNPPLFTYEPLQTAIRDMLVLGVPYRQVEEFVRRAERRPNFAQTLLEILPLAQAHLEGIKLDGFQEVAPRAYLVARDVTIMFRPPLIYRCEGRFHLPWFSYWRSNPLASKRLSLFVTMVEEMMLQDPDLEDAKFEILDFSVPKSKSKRELVITDADAIPRLDVRERNEMLEIFAEGYRLARKQLLEEKPKSEPTREQAPPAYFDQGDLFG
jgi:hypothetical protein